MPTIRIVSDMRNLLLALLSLLCISCASNEKARVTEVNIVDIKPRYIDDESFKRVSEYLTGKENRGKRIIMRTDASQRDGFYFVLILDEKIRDLPAGTYIEGEFYTPKSKDKQVHSFNLPAKLSRSKEIFIGLTGEDWISEDDVPAAWRFTIKSSNGDVLATRKSYLWSI